MVTRSPRAFSRLPREEAVSPLPSDEATPPVTKTCLVGWRSAKRDSRGSRCAARKLARPRGSRLARAPGRIGESTPDISGVARSRLLAGCWLVAGHTRTRARRSRTAPVVPRRAGHLLGQGEHGDDRPGGRVGESTVETALATATSPRTPVRTPSRRRPTPGLPPRPRPVAASREPARLRTMLPCRPSRRRRPGAPPTTRTRLPRRARSPSVAISPAVESPARTPLPCSSTASPRGPRRCRRRRRAGRRGARSSLASRGDGRPWWLRPPAGRPARRPAACSTTSTRSCVDPDRAGQRCASRGLEGAGQPGDLVLGAARAAPAP